VEDFNLKQPHFEITPSRRRPLLGVTIMLVEDSRFCSEAVRLMSIKSGARLRRADCLMSARRHLAIYRPNVVLVDIGLPDGSGIEIIRELRGLGAQAPAIIAMSGDDAALAQKQARAAGAQSFVIKPLQDLAQFQQVILAELPRQDGTRRFSPRLVGSLVRPDKKTYRQDLGHARAVLEKALPDRDKDKVLYCAKFLGTVAQMACDRDMQAISSALTARVALGFEGQKTGAQTLDLLHQRLTKPAAD
jgi:CheY-like chemotaxis protein